MKTIIYTIDNIEYVLVDRAFSNVESGNKFIDNVAVFDGVVQSIGIIKRGFLSKDLIQVKVLIPSSMILKASKIL